MTVSINDVVEQDFGLSGFLYKGAHRTVQLVVVDAEVPSVFVPCLHQGAQHILERPASSFFGAITENGRARHPDKCAGHLPSLLIEQSGKTPGEVAFRAH